MLKIEELRRKHNRSEFDCGASELNQYLKTIARQHIIKGISRTFILIDSETPADILGFFTLAFCEIRASDLPAHLSKKYPPRAPAAKLARLAVSKNRQRQGLGSLMMINAMERTLIVSSHMGIIGFFVDAKDNGAKKYYEQFGFLALPSNPLTLFVPLKKLRESYNAATGNWKRK